MCIMVYYVTGILLQALPELNDNQSHHRHAKCHHLWHGNSGSIGFDSDSGIIYFLGVRLFPILHFCGPRHQLVGLRKSEVPVAKVLFASATNDPIFGAWQHFQTFLFELLA